MGRSGLPTTLAICCRLPADMPRPLVEACRQAAVRAAVPVTWITAVERLALVAGHGPEASASRHVALEMPEQSSVSGVRRLLADAGAAVPGLEAVVLHGDVSQEQRRLLVEGGVRIACRSRLDDTSRGSRRPAPPGWPCRSTLWGLWEVVMTQATPPGMVSRLLPWGSRPAQGGLVVVDVGGGTPDAVAGRLEQWRAWAGAGRPGDAPRAVCVHLADLADLITGGGRHALGGSVLRAAA